MRKMNIKEPTGKERMRRPPSKTLRPRSIEFDIKKAYTQEQLSEIGAIALVWNQIEAFIDFLILIVVGPAPGVSSVSVWLEIQKRINSLDAKIDILQLQSEESAILDTEAKKAIKNALDAVLEYRIYRNGIVHSFVFDHKKGIGQYIEGNRRPWQILVTIDALSALYERLVILKDELREIDLLYRISQGSLRVTIMNSETGKPELNQPKALREKGVPQQTARVLSYQKEVSVEATPKISRCAFDFAAGFACGNSN